MGTPEARHKPKVRRTTISGAVELQVLDNAVTAARLKDETLSAFVAVAVEERARRVLRAARRVA